MNATTTETTTATQAFPKSLRAAKLRMTKLGKGYDEALKLRAEGFRMRRDFEATVKGDELIARANKLARSFVVAMETFRAECRAQGWFVSNHWLDYFESSAARNCD